MLSGFLYLFIGWLFVMAIGYAIIKFFKFIFGLSKKTKNAEKKEQQAPTTQNPTTQNPYIETHLIVRRNYGDSEDYIYSDEEEEFVLKEDKNGDNKIPVKYSNKNNLVRLLPLKIKRDKEGFVLFLGFKNLTDKTINFAFSEAYYITYDNQQIESGAYGTLYYRKILPSLYLKTEIEFEAECDKFTGNDLVIVTIYIDNVKYFIGERIATIQDNKVYKEIISNN